MLIKIKIIVTEIKLNMKKSELITFTILHNYSNYIIIHHKLFILKKRNSCDSRMNIYEYVSKAIIHVKSVKT